MSAISGGTRSASIISQGRSVVRRYPGEKIMEIIEKYPEVSRHLFKTVVSRLEMASKLIIKAGKK